MMNYKKQLSVLIAVSVFALGSLGAHANNSQQSKMTTATPTTTN